MQAAQNITTDAAAGNMIFRTTSTTVAGSPIERMRIDSAGNVSIGTATAFNKLTIVDTVSDSHIGGSLLGGAGQWKLGVSSSGYVQLGSVGATPLRFIVGNSEKLRIDSIGVGIGTATPTTGTRLDIVGATSADSSIVIPRAAVADRPAVGVNGMMRYASDTNKFEAYQNGAWIDMIGGVSSSVAAGAGSAAAPSISFSSDTDTGFYSSGDGTIGIAANGAQVFNFSSTSLSSPTTGGALITSGNGTAAAPTFSFAGDPDTGWFRPAADTMAASTAGAERVRIDSTGRVGIGTSAPTYNLVVGDDLGTFPFAGGSKATILGNTTGGAYTVIGQGNSNHVELNWIYNATPANAYGQLATYAFNNPIRIDGSSVVMQTLSGGKVGVGTTSPSGLFQAGAVTDTSTYDFTNTGAVLSSTGVNQTAARSNVMTLMRSGTGGVVYAGAAAFDLSRWQSVGLQADTQLDIRLAGATTAALTDVMSLRSNGNVGIGTTTPGYKLDISAGDIHLDSGNKLRFGTTGSGVQGGDSASGFVSLQTNGSDRMLVDYNGNVGIGTITPASLFDVSSTTGAIQTISRNNVTVVSGDSIGAIQFWNNDTQLTTQKIYGNIEMQAAQNITTDAAAGNMIFRTTASTVAGSPIERMRIDSAGRVGIGTTVPAQKFVVSNTPAIASTASQTNISAFAGNGMRIEATGGTISSQDAITYQSSSVGAGAALAFGRGVSWDTFMSFYTNDILNSGMGNIQERMRIDSAGNVGIGITAPLDKLHVNAGAVLGGGLHISGTASPGINIVAGGSELDFGIASSNGSYVLAALANDSVVRTYSGGNLVLANTAGSAIKFSTGTTSTNDTVKMTILSNGDVGIANASPAYKLDVAGQIRSSAGGYVFPDGTVATTAVTSATSGTTSSTDLTFAADTDANGSGVISFAVGGIEKMRMDSTGNVGFGTGSPESPLTVSSDSYTSNLTLIRNGFLTAIPAFPAGFLPTFTVATAQTAFSRPLFFGYPNAGSWAGFMTTGACGTYNDICLDFGSGATVYSAFRSTGSTLLVGGGINSDGNYSIVSLAPVSGTVGVGVTAPSAQLDVKGVGDTLNQSSLLLRSGNSLSNFNSNQITFGYNAANTYRHVIKTRHNGGGSAGNAMDFYTWKYSTDVSTAIGTQQVMTLDGNGNVGIGTTSPTAPLHVSSGGRYVTASPNAFGRSVIGMTSPGVIEINGDGTRSMYLTQASDTAFAVGLGDDTPDARFEIFGGGGVFPKLMISSTADSNGDLMIVTSAGNVGIGLTAPAYALDVSGDVNIAAANVLRFGGTQVCASAGCTAVSDRRLKEDVQSLENSLDNILKLQGVSYDWIDKEKYGQSQQIGLIAQDLEKVYPQAVVTDAKSGLKSVAYDHLVAPLIEAFKELNQRVNELFNASERHSREMASVKAQAKAEKAAKDQEIAELKARLEKIEKSLNSK